MTWVTETLPPSAPAPLVKFQNALWPTSSKVCPPLHQNLLSLFCEHPYTHNQPLSKVLQYLTSTDRHSPTPHKKKYTHSTIKRREILFNLPPAVQTGCDPINVAAAADLNGEVGVSLHAHASLVSGWKRRVAAGPALQHAPRSLTLCLCQVLTGRTIVSKAARIGRSYCSFSFPPNCDKCFYDAKNVPRPKNSTRPQNLQLNFCES